MLLGWRKIRAGIGLGLGASSALAELRSGVDDLRERGLDRTGAPGLARWAGEMPPLRAEQRALASQIALGPLHNCRGSAGAGVLTAVLLVVVVGLGCTQAVTGQQSDRVGPVDEQGRRPISVGKVIKKRQIAPVMSVAHADWLVRPERDVQEQPDRVVKKLQIPEGGTVVDLGAGVGYFTWRLAKAVGDEGKVIAVDIQPGMIDRLRETLEERGVTNVEPVLGSEENPNLPEDAVDLVLVVDVYHELQQPEQTMEYVRRSLKPDGRLVVIEYRKEDPNIPIHPLHKMTVDEVRAELEPMGFEFEELKSFLPTQHIIIFKRRI